MTQNCACIDHTVEVACARSHIVSGTLENQGVGVFCSDKALCPHCMDVQYGVQVLFGSTMEFMVLVTFYHNCHHQGCAAVWSSHS